MERSEFINKPGQAGVALKAVFKILQKWGASEKQQCAILQLSVSSCSKLQSDQNSVKLSPEQLERISYLLNIHASLRSIFDNPENVYGYMSMKNNNPPFNGRSPLDLLSDGQLRQVYVTFKHMEGGLW